MNYLIGIGSNIGNAENNVNNAIKALSLLPKTKVVRASSLYESSPVGYAKQSNFINAVCEAESEFDIHEMLGACLGIEAGFGRIREFKNGPRIIDIDLLCAKDENEKPISESSKNLTLPHPEIKNRRFVLEPLYELHPENSAWGIENIKEISNAIPNQQIEKIQQTY